MFPPIPLKKNEKLTKTIEKYVIYLQNTRKNHACFRRKKCEIFGFVHTLIMILDKF